jgi:valyl-tRNA synthetase
VLLSGLIVDETGEKMSKVKGNVIDPLDLIHGTTFAELVKKTLPGAPEAEALTKFKKAYPSAATMGTGFPAFGTDAVRFTLATYPPSNKRIALAPRRIEGNRHFLNKIWNATRLSLDLLDGAGWSDAKPAHLYNRWIESRLANAIAISNAGYGAFRIDEAANEGYRFFWSDFCDWYLELVKPILRKSEDGKVGDLALAPETKATLVRVLEGTLRMLHPMMPYITEELWQRLPRPASRKVSIAFGPFPEDKEIARDLAAEKEMAVLQAVISAARTVRSEHDIKKEKVPLAIRTDDAATLARLAERKGAIGFLVNTNGEASFEKLGGPREPGTTVTVVPTDSGPIEVLVGLKGLVTREEELARIARERKRLEKDVAAVDKKLSSKGFVDKAPKEVVEEAQALRASLLEALARLDEAAKLAEEL